MNLHILQKQFLDSCKKVTREIVNKFAMIPNGLEPITEEEYNAITSVEGKTVEYSAKRRKKVVY